MCVGVWDACWSMMLQQHYSPVILTQNGVQPRTNATEANSTDFVSYEYGKKPRRILLGESFEKHPHIAYSYTYFFSPFFFNMGKNFNI